MVRTYKYEGIRIKIDDSSVTTRLKVHLKEKGQPYYKTYYYLAVDKEFNDREGMAIYLKEYIERMIKR